jgi:hypothetical protein
MSWFFLALLIIGIISIYIITKNETKVERKIAKHKKSRSNDTTRIHNPVLPSDKETDIIKKKNTGEDTTRISKVLPPTTEERVIHIDLDEY